jgi:predicted nucleic acid-binding protein
LLGFSALATSALTRLISGGHINVPFRFAEEWKGVTQLMSRYHQAPMSFADACLVRMAELYDNAPVLTLDGHFRIYRKNRRQIIRVIHPDNA